jgi:hypothetical protein
MALGNLWFCLGECDLVYFVDINDLNRGGAIVNLAIKNGINLTHMLDLGRQVQLSSITIPVPYEVDGKKLKDYGPLSLLCDRLIQIQQGSSNEGHGRQRVRLSDGLLLVQ